MKKTSQNRARPGAFTLIEPLVVITLLPPALSRAKLRANSPVVSNPSTPPGSFAYGSYSSASSLSGEISRISKQTSFVHTSERYLWVEENDPRGENIGSRFLNAGSPPGLHGNLDCGFGRRLARQHQHVQLGGRPCRKSQMD